MSAQDASQHACMYSRIQAIVSIFTVVYVLMIRVHRCISSMRWYKPASVDLAGVTMYLQIYVYLYICLFVIYTD